MTALTSALLSRLAVLDLAIRRRVLGEGPGRRAALRRGEGTTFRGHRAYAPGDDVRYLDWSAYARLGAPFLKEFEAEEAVRFVAVLDRTASLAATVTDADAAAYARELTAVLSYVALSRYDGVDLWTVPGGASGDTLRGAARAPILLARLDAAVPGGTGRLAEAAAAVPAPTGGAYVVVVSDCWDLADLATCLLTLGHRRLQSAVVHVAGPGDLPEHGRMLLRDAETGASREVRCSPGLATRYRETVAHHHDEVARRVRATGAAYARVDPRQPLEQAVFGPLRRGGVLR